MNPDDQLRSIARALFWWLSPEQALANPRRFAAQVMTYGTWEEARDARRLLGSEVFRDALENAPPGVFDPRSWTYWRAFFGLPEAELPRRSLT